MDYKEQERKCNLRRMRGEWGYRVRGQRELSASDRTPMAATYTPSTAFVRHSDDTY